MPGPGLYFRVMTDKPDLDGKFGKRVGLAYRPAPENGDGAYIVQHIWDTPDHWVVCQHKGNVSRVPFDWDFIVDTLGDEEEGGRFASMAIDYIAKTDLDAAALKARLEGEFTADEAQIGWLDGWPA